jgi:hypothetical protein
LEAIPSQLFFWRQRLVASAYDDAGNMIETHEHKGDFKESVSRERPVNLAVHQGNLHKGMPRPPCS